MDQRRKIIITDWLLGPSLGCLGQLEIAAQPRLHDTSKGRNQKAIPPLLLRSRPLLDVHTGPRPICASICARVPPLLALRAAVGRLF